MGSEAAKLIILTGSPLASMLTWSESTLTTPLLPSFDDGNSRKIEPLSRSSNQHVGPRWRTLPIERRHLPTGLTQPSFLDWPDQDKPFDGDDERSTFTSSSSIQPASEPESTSAEEDRSHFYEHSFAIHETTDFQSSNELKSNDSSLDDTFDTTLESPNRDAVPDLDSTMARNRLTRSNPSSLRDMPSARHLHAVSPQTLTVDLIVGVISISQPRSITTRRNQRVQLVEMIVGDETSAGFAVSIWLDEPRHFAAGGQHLTSDAQSEALRAQATRLRPRDIVLARNVALGSFRNQVSGQSLRRGLTTLDLLYRHAVDATDRKGLLRSREIEGEAAAGDAKMARVKRTKEWVAEFVGARARSSRNARAEGESILSVLPDDTQSFDK